MKGANVTEWIEHLFQRIEVQQEGMQAAIADVWVCIPWAQAHGKDYCWAADLCREHITYMVVTQASLDIIGQHFEDTRTILKDIELFAERSAWRMPDHTCLLNCKGAGAQVSPPKQVTRVCTWALGAFQ